MKNSRIVTTFNLNYSAKICGFLRKNLSSFLFLSELFDYKGLNSSTLH